jgi:tRNA(His) 5'-end guanylyltransferase
VTVYEEADEFEGMMDKQKEEFRKRTAKLGLTVSAFARMKTL